MTVRTEDGEQHIDGSHLPAAIGRIPNTEALNPDAAGFRLTDHGFIDVDEHLETSVPGIYAMGMSIVQVAMLGRLPWSQQPLRHVRRARSPMSAENEDDAHDRMPHDGDIMSPHGDDT